LFTCYVLGNSGWYLVMFVVTLTIALIRLDSIIGVEQK